ncbi:MAG: PAS domain-containing sensor histidine kinase [Actinobacteria bacterium]|nr:PAS domain-containing sensor histidine kinase [Actinomycetota bacterium]
MDVVRRVQTQDSATDGASVVPLVAGWFAAGATALPVLAAITGPQVTLSVVFFVILALTVMAETFAVQLQAGGSALSLSLLEAVVVVAILLLTPVSAVLAVLTGVAISHTIRRMGLLKIVFNIGQHAVAVTTAAGIVALVPAEPAVGPSRLAAAMVAVLVYSAINSVALAGIFARLGLVSFREQLTERPGFLVATSVGNASVGALAATVWVHDPSVVWLIVGPVLALYLSYGSSFRIESLLSDVSSQRDRLDRVVTGVQEGIVLLDGEGRIRLWNPAMTRITGVEEEAAIGRPASSILTGADGDGTSFDPERVLRERLPTAAYTVALPHAAGGPVDVRLEHTLVTDDRGRFVGDVILVQDLSREREAHALKEDFVARVSHELRTPLSPLRGYAQILLDAGDQVPEQKRRTMLETMVERVGHLERLIDDLLLVSKAVSGGLTASDEMTPEATDVGALVLGMSDWVVRDHPDREVRFHLEGSGHVAWADPTRTSQIVMNLVKNACKYATPGTPVDVLVSHSDGEVQVAVQDAGPGIPEDKLEAVFERFQRLEDPQRMRTGGLGLGLYIARHLATVMGGRLAVESGQGRSSTFTLALPAATAEQRRSMADAGARPSGSRVHRREDHVGRPNLPLNDPT